MKPAGPIMDLPVFHVIRFEPDEYQSMLEPPVTIQQASIAAVKAPV